MSNNKLSIDPLILSRSVHVLTLRNYSPFEHMRFRGDGTAGIRASHRELLRQRV